MVGTFPSSSMKTITDPSHHEGILHSLFNRWFVQACQHALPYMNLVDFHFYGELVKDSLKIFNFLLLSIYLGGGGGGCLGGGFHIAGFSHTFIFFFSFFLGFEMSRISSCKIVRSV